MAFTGVLVLEHFETLFVHVDLLTLLLHLAPESLDFVLFLLQDDLLFLAGIGLFHLEETLGLTVLLLPVHLVQDLRDVLQGVPELVGVVEGHRVFLRLPDLGQFLFQLDVLSLRVLQLLSQCLVLLARLGLVLLLTLQLLHPTG